MNTFRHHGPVLLGSAVLALLVGGCSGPEARRVQAIARGDDYLAAGKVDKARVEYMNALQVVPNDPEGRYKNGVIQERIGNVREAAQYYHAAIDVAPGYTKARAALARLFLFTGAPELALETVKPGLETNASEVPLLVIRAAARAQMKDPVGALADAEQAYGIDPKSEDVVAVLAGLYSANEHPDKAQRLLEAGIREHAGSIDLRLALAQLYASREQRPLAEAQLREIVRLKPEDSASRIRLAQFLAHDGDFEQAEKALREAVAVLPKDAQVNAALIEFLTGRRGRPAAEAELVKSAAAAARGDYEPRFALARFYEQGKETAKAEAIYKNAIADDGTGAAGLTARTRLAALRAAQNDAAGAEALVNEVLAVNRRDADALVLRGDLLLSRGDAVSAIGDLRAALRDQPNAVGVMRVLARAHVQNREPALAEEVLHRALEADAASAGARMDLAQLLIHQGQPEQAKPLLERLAKDHPGDVTIQESLFRVCMEGNDLATARTAAESLRDARPESGIGEYFLGRIAEAQHRPDEALQAYERSLKQRPGAAEPMQASTRLLTAAKRFDEALRRLDAQAALAPQSPVPLSFKGEVLMVEGRLAEAEDSFRAAITRAPTWWVPYRGLAIVGRQKGNDVAAVAVLEGALGKVSEPNLIRGEIERIYESSGRIDDAIRVSEEMVKAAPKAPDLANNLAMLIANNRKDRASLNRAMELTDSFGNDSPAQYLDTYGWVRFKQGDLKAALPALEKAGTTRPHSPEIDYHLGMARAAAGQVDAARQVLAQALVGDGRYPGRDEARATLDRLAAGR